MVTRIFLIPVLFLAGCCIDKPAQVDPLLGGMEQLKALFETEQANTRSLVASSNPQPAVYEQFLRAQEATYGSYMVVYRAMAQQVASIGVFTPEQTEQLLQRITDTIVLIRGAGDDQ